MQSQEDKGEFDNWFWERLAACSPKQRGENYTFGLELLPTQDASHHQDYSMFSRESQKPPSFVTGILGGGVRPKL